jgi:hypothetical protein
MSDGTNNQNNTDTEKMHNTGITQASYDEAKRKERLYYGQATDLEKKLNEFGGYDSIKEKLFELDELKNKSAKSPEDVQKIVNSKIEEVRTPLLKQLEAEEKKAKELADKLYKIEVVDSTISNIGKLFQEDTLPVIKDLYISRFVKKDESGELVILDDNGQIRYSGSKKMDITDFANEILQKHPSFKAGQSSNNSRPTGGAGNKVANSGKPLTESEYKALSKEDRIKYLRETKYSTPAKQQAAK